MSFGRASSCRPWSPDGRWIAYVTWTEEGGHLWKADAAGGTPERLSDTPALWADPVWTPDGDAVIALRASLGAAALVPSVGPGTAVPPSADIVSIPTEAAAVHRKIAPSNGLRFPHFGPATDGVYLSSGEAGLVRLPLTGGPLDTVATLAVRPRPNCASVPTANSSPCVWPIRHARANDGDRRGRSGTPHGRGPAAHFGRCDERGVDAGRYGFAVDRGGHASDGPAPTAARRRPRRRSVSRCREPPRPVPSVLSGAKLVTMRGDEVIEQGDVVVTNGRITWVGPTGTRPLPDGAPRHRLVGRVIVPGFIDVHAHFGARGELLEPEGTFAFSNLSFGITTVRTHKHRSTCLNLPT